MLGTALLALLQCAAGPPVMFPPAVRRVAASEQAGRLLALRCVEVSAEEHAAVPFVQVFALLTHPDALRHLLIAYASESSEATDAESSIAEVGEAVYFYRNEDGDPTEVQTIYSGPGAAGAVEIVVFSQGRRSFGEFRALVQVVAWQDGDGTRYRVDVKAYPEHAFLRFLARDLGFGRRFFRSRTRELCQLAERIVPSAARGAAAHVAVAAVQQAERTPTCANVTLGPDDPIGVHRQR